MIDGWNLIIAEVREKIIFEISQIVCPVWIEDMYANEIKNKIMHDLKKQEHILNDKILNRYLYKITLDKDAYKHPTIENLFSNSKFEIIKNPK